MTISFPGFNSGYLADLSEVLLDVLCTERHVGFNVDITVNDSIHAA